MFSSKEARRFRTFSGEMVGCLSLSLTGNDRITKSGGKYERTPESRWTFGIDIIAACPRSSSIYIWKERIMRKAIFSVVFVVTFLAGASVVSAQWRQLGSKEVDYNADHETIGVGAMKGDLRRIQLRVQRAPVRFERVVVNFRNGGTQEVPVRELIRAGGS